MARPKGYIVRLEEADRKRLCAIVAGRSRPQGEALRSRILLACEAHGDWTDRQVAHRIGCAWQTVKKWRRRWHETRSVRERPRPGRPRKFSP
jgi:transposase